MGDTLFCITGTPEEGLCGKIAQLIMEHPDTVLLVVDTFQTMREKWQTFPMPTIMMASGKKTCGHEYGVTLFLVHHLRKQGSGGPLMDSLSRTTGNGGVLFLRFSLCASGGQVRQNSQQKINDTEQYDGWSKKACFRERFLRGGGRHRFRGQRVNLKNQVQEPCENREGE